MNEFKKHWINDEPELPKLSSDFSTNVSKHFEDQDARDSLLVKRLGPEDGASAIRGGGLP